MDTSLIVDREEDFSDEEAINYLLANGKNVAKVMGVTHRAPAIGGVTPCCGYTIFELSRWDRATVDPERVTCEGRR